MKMRIRAILALCGIGLGCPVISADQVTVTRYEYSMAQHVRTPDGKIADKVQKQTEYRASDGRQRIDAGDDTVQIGQPRTNVVFVLNMEKKTYYRVAYVVGGVFTGSGPSPLGSAPPPSRSEYFPAMGNIGTKRILGLTCNGSATPRMNDKSSYFEMWQCADPASPGSSFKVTAETILQRGDGTGYHQTLRRVTPNIQVPEIFFDVPSSFRQVPAP